LVTADASVVVALGLLVPLMSATHALMRPNLGNDVEAVGEQCDTHLHDVTKFLALRYEVDHSGLQDAVMAAIDLATQLNG